MPQLAKLRRAPKKNGRGYRLPQREDRAAARYVSCPKVQQARGDFHLTAAAGDMDYAAIHMGNTRRHMTFRVGNMSSRVRPMDLRAGDMTLRACHMTQRARYMTSRAGHMDFRAGDMTSRAGRLDFAAGDMTWAVSHMDITTADMDFPAADMTSAILTAFRLCAGHVGRELSCPPPTSTKPTRARRTR